MANNQRFPKLQELFGQQIQSEPYSFPKHTPVYIRDGFTAQRISMSGSSCILITPADLDIHLPVLKKQYENIQKVSEDPIVLNLQYLTAVQRRNLIESRIPFLSLPYQVYLPFWGCFFTNRFNTQRENKGMTAAAQLVYLHMFYRGTTVPATHKEICEALGLSKAGGTRAIQVLDDFGLIEQIPEGTRKKIILVPESLNKAIKVMNSPIQKILYLRSAPALIPHMFGGIRALSMKSMIAAETYDGSIVFSRGKARTIPAELQITADEFKDLGGIPAEVWGYDPFLLSSDNSVDDISLLLTLQDNDDERIQKELDKIRSRYGLII